MVYRIKNNLIKIGLSVVCSVLMVAGYQFFYEWYCQHYTIRSHRNVGVTFI
jgi:hypothetical protein